MGLLNKVKPQLTVTTVFGCLIAIGSLMNLHRAAAQNPSQSAPMTAQLAPFGLPVSIVSPLPVPVTGSTTVAGTVAATQSGAWNVGINGTPAVQLASGASVLVGNTPANPLFMRDVDRPARQPWHIDVQGGGNGGTTIPTFPNKTIVIEYISGVYGLLFSGSINYHLRVQVGPDIHDTYITFSDSGRPFIQTPVRIYIPAGAVATYVPLSATAAFDPNFVLTSFNGYLVDN